MATAAELVLESQLADLRQNAGVHGWFFDRVDPTSFVLGLLAKDGSDMALYVKCDAYPGEPPAWHWYNRETKVIDAPGDTPMGGSFFHSSGVICAPWNRLAYKSKDPRGPHSDWDIGNWMAVRQTGGTRTLPAMAGRVAHELRTSYTGRGG